MAFDMDTIKQGIYNWVTNISGVQVIWLEPNAPRPDLPYIGLDIGSYQSVGEDYQTAPDDNGMASLFGDREFTLEINYYGSNGHNIMEKLRTSLQQFDVRNNLADKGVVFVDDLTTQGATELLDTLYESRKIMEATFRVSNQGVTDPGQFEVGVIETVEGEITAKDQKGSVVKKQDFN